MKNWNFYLLLGLILFPSACLFSQAIIEVTVTGGTATTTCTDIFGNPDPMWAVNVAGTGYEYYPQQGACFTPLPNVQYSQTYTCLSNAPATINICFRAFENDGLIGCAISPDCQQTICQNFPIPPAATSVSHTLALPPGLSSGGNVQFTISASGTGAMPNENPCEAVDAGVLNIGESWGDPNASTYFNFCADAVGDPSPVDQGASWYNNVGLWFTFTTGPDPAPYVEITALSDPENLGDSVNLQMALWTTADGTCSSPFTLVDDSFVNGDWDEVMLSNCLEPNTTYFILVDGTADTPPELYGYFSLGIQVWDVFAAGDLPCEALDMGAVPENGSVTTLSLYSNRCATSAGDPPVTGFFSDKPVWFAFQAPLSGHVLIDAQSNSLDPVNIQLALFESADDSCTGAFSQVDFSYSPVSFNEALEVSCLNPGRTYWVLVDGATNNRDGIFTLTLTDEGGDTPVTNQAFVLCAGSSVTVGPNTYSISGLYTDTLYLPSGCDSIVITDLTVLEELILSFTNVQMASGLGNLDGSALASGAGGQPPYTFEWSNGQTAPQATGLEGGAAVCVTLTDSNGCADDTCFTMPFFTFIAPTAAGDSLDCSGDADGVFTFSAVGGIPPYNYAWQNDDNSLNGAGSIAAAGEVVSVSNLPAGLYTLTIADAMIDTSVSVLIWEPQPLSASLLLQENVSCFGECDAQLDIEALGGTPGYQYAWSNGSNGATLSGLCAGEYEVTITDANECTFVIAYTVTQPPEFIATIQIVQHVSCFEGSDGILTVSATGGTPSTYAWSNGDQTATISGLSAGLYTVTVTNQDNCQEVVSAAVVAPTEPVGVAIQLQEAISCFGANDGRLTAVVSGPGQSFTYAWSNGASGSAISNLGPGDYEVTVSNELGCAATAQWMLSQPTEVVAQVEAVDITCETLDIGGSIFITSATGGTGPYLYSLDSGILSADTAFLGLSAGPYDVYVSDANGCEHIYPVVVQPAPVLILDLGDDLSVSLGEPAALFAQLNSSNAVFEWTVSTGDWACANAACQEIAFLPVDNGLVAVTAFDTLTKCQASDAVFINVLKDRRLFIPNIFSPNYDGVNDHFTLYGKTGVELIRVFRVFDRNGALVFEATGLSPGDEPRGWDGTFRGRPAPAGVYTFFAEVVFIDQEVEVFKGDVTLVR